MKSLIWLAVLAAVLQAQPAAPQNTPPFATMEQGNVTLHPSNATFVVPEEVLTDRRAAGFTRYLTRNELAYIKTVDPTNWDAPYARVLDAALPFSACVVHLGTEPWGAGSRSFGDLQIRVYILDGPAAPVRDAIAGDGLAEAIRVFAAKARFPPTAQFPDPALTTPATGNAWSLSRIYYLRRESDFGAGVNLDFYVREFGQQTVVLFMHYPPATRLNTWDSAVAKILASFAWPK